MYADEMLGVLDGECGGDLRSPVAALGAVPGVAEPGHQLIPGVCDALRTPPGLCRFAAEAESWQGRAHDVERVTGASAGRHGIGQRLDDLGELDDRARPAVRHDQRDGALVWRANVEEMNRQPVDDRQK